MPRRRRGERTAFVWRDTVKGQTWGRRGLALALAAMALAGCLTVAGVRGWLDGGRTDRVLLAEVTGVVQLTRSGISLRTGGGLRLRAGDRLQGTPGSRAVLHWDGGTLTLGPEAVLTVEDPEATDFRGTLETGEAVADVTGSLTLTAGGRTVTLTDTAALASGEGITDLTGPAGTVSAGTLSRFALGTLLAVTDRELCLSEAALRQALAAQKGIGDPGSGDRRCTITIRCDSILAHPELLNPAKAEFIPADGVILPETDVSFSDGETVFDVLKRVCEAAEIPLEYSWTPVYDSYYLEGINRLYEFDCGAQSGWMYQVNDVFPNYGCSDYALQDSDRIVWCYTCTGLGADVGGGVAG